MIGNVKNRTWPRKPESKRKPTSNNTAKQRLHHKLSHSRQKSDTKSETASAKGALQ